MFRTVLLILLLGACAVRMAAGCWWESRLPAGRKFAFPDSEAYWELARAVADGGPFQLNPDRRVFRVPGYPAVLASVFWLGGDDPPVLWGRWLGAILGTLAVGGIVALAGLLFDWQTALVAGAAAAVYPDAVAMSTFVLSEAPFCPWMMLQLCCWTIAWRAANPRQQAVWALLGGLAAGVATLMRPSWLLFTPFALAVGGFRPADWRRHGWLGLWLLLGVTAAMAPWWIRNWQLTGRFVPTTLQVGESLYDGLSPQATGASEMAFVDRFRDELRADDAAHPAAAGDGECFEMRLDRRMRDAALGWAAGHPAHVIRLAGVKFLRIWNVWPNEASLRNGKFRVVIAGTYLPALLLGLWGVWRTAGRGWPYVLCLLPAVYFTALHMVFVGSIRYRQPAMLVLLVPAAAAVVEGWRKACPPSAPSPGSGRA